MGCGGSKLPEDFLVPQWVRSVERFLPTARIGIVQRDRVEIDADVVIFMMASVVSCGFEIIII